MAKDEIRDRLIKLVIDATDIKDRLVLFGAACRVADYLLANGVTFAEDINVPTKWIPVSERLPKDGQSVLTYKNGVCDIMTYEERRNGWISKGWFWSMATVTHWMPLPSLPKED